MIRDVGTDDNFLNNYHSDDDLQIRWIYGDRLESGDGFADIIFRKIRGSGPNIIMELKRSDSEKDVEKDSESAHRQGLHA